MTPIKFIMKKVCEKFKRLREKNLYEEEEEEEEEEKEEEEKV